MVFFTNPALLEALMTCDPFSRIQMRRVRTPHLIAAALTTLVSACATVESPDAEPRTVQDAGCGRPPCDIATDPGTGGACVPDCSPGYVCIDGACVTSCNPPCSAGQICGADRVCVAAPDADPAQTDAIDVADAPPADTATDTAPPDVSGEVRPTDTTSDTPCFAESATPREVRTPVDLVLAVDTSGSMDQETDNVERQLNELARRVGSAGADIRVVLVANNDICIPPPLSASIGCPDVDGPSYLHVRRKVDSSEVFSTILAAWADISPFLRPSEASLHFLVVTDDNDDMTGASFRSSLATVDSRAFVFHSLTAASISGTDSGLAPCLGPTGIGAAVGTQYRILSDLTGGVKGSICTDDWAGVFAALATAIADRTLLPCEFELPDPGPGREVDPERVNVQWTPAGGSPRLLPNVADADGCTARGGWFWSDASRTRLVLCPSVCGDTDGNIDLELGCETVKE